MVGCFGVDSGFSPSVIWGQQGVINPWRGFRHGWTIGSVGIDEMASFAEKMLSVGKEVQDSTSAGLRQKAFFWFVVAGGNFVCHKPAISQP